MDTLASTSTLPSYLSADQLGPWSMYLEQLDRVAPHLGALAQYLETLRRPQRIIIVNVPIKLDNGGFAHFEGYRIHHNNIRGPGKGGVRFHPQVALPEVMALAAWM